MWFNMREEPVIYINGNPYVVREANKPFANLEYTGAMVNALQLKLYHFCELLHQGQASFTNPTSEH